MEVARNGAVQQASSRGKADLFVLSSVIDSSSDREHDVHTSEGSKLAAKDKTWNFEVLGEP